MSSPLLKSIDRIHEGGRHWVKDREKASLFREICVGRVPTRKGLAHRLDLRPSSVSVAVQELLDDNLVEEKQPRVRANMGRPRLILSPRHDRCVAISVYVDSREFKGVLANIEGKALAEEVRIVPADAGNRELKGTILALLASLQSRVPAGSELAGACISLVGTVNARTMMWVGVARWPKLHNLDLSTIAPRFGFPVILRRTNEVELEYFLERTSASTGITAVLFHWGFGIGTAVSSHGTLLSSSIGRFGEIGHARLDTRADAHCPCGARGCLETVAALWALFPALRKSLGDLPEDEKELAPILKDSRIMDLPAMRRALSAVQVALLVLYKIFYPDLILLSGPFMQNPQIVRSLSNNFRQMLPEYTAGTTRLTVIPDSMPGCLRGAVSPLFREALARLLRRKT
jgi:predicted NBD/HSP70 family sugar kinase